MQLHYKELLENITDWSWKSDAKGTFTYCSDGVFNFLGYRADEVIGKSFFDFVDESDRERITQKIAEITLSKKPFIDFEKIYLHKNGNKVHISSSSIPIFDKDGNLQGFQGVEKDLSKIIEREKKSKATEERLELALIGSNDGVWDWDIINNSVYFSPRWKDMLGFRDDELINEFSTWSERVHPDDFDETWANVQEHINSKTEYYEGIHRLKHKDGSWVWILDRGKAIFDKNGKALRMIGTHTDITQQKAQELKAVHQRQMIEEIHDSVISTDLDGIITTWNNSSETLLGYSPQEAIGKHISLIYLDEDLESLEQNIATLLKRGENYVTVRLVTKTKDILYVDLQLSILKDEKSIPIGLVGYSKDITKRKQAENTLEQQARMVQMGEMLSMIAHQWRQPLNAISLTAANLKLKFDFNGFDLSTKKGFDRCNKEMSEKLYAIEEHVQTLSTTIDDFRNFYKTDKEYVLTLLEDVISKSLNVMNVSLIEENIEIIKEYNSNIKVEMYENEIVQVILNLLKNAQDNFLEKRIQNPCIKITTDKNKISISDNGGGIPKEMIDKIFNPYFSTKTDKNGTGLGLYMSKTIIEEHHNAKLSVKNLKNGACFTIEFL